MRVLLIMNGSRERYAGGADEARKRVWTSHCSPGTQLDIGYLPSESENGVSRSYEFGSGQAMLFSVLYPERIALAEREGYDAAIIHCFAEPGLEASRKHVSIPVIGPGEVTLRAGVIRGGRIGMTVPGDQSVESHMEQIRRLGIEDNVVGLEPINFPIGKYAEQDPQAMTDALVKAAQKLVDKGANVLCPSGLAFIPVRVSAREVSERIGIPVLDPAIVSLRTAELLYEAAPKPARQSVAV